MEALRRIPTLLEIFRTAVTNPVFALCLANARHEPIYWPACDELASRMGVELTLDHCKNRRYYKVHAPIFAQAIGNKIRFGSAFYTNLTESQRIAIVAHEFVHIREHHTRSRLKRIFLPALGASFVSYAVAFGMIRWDLFDLFVALLGFAVALPVISRLEAERSRVTELRCDVEAASFVDGKHLIEALKVAESMLSAKFKQKPTGRGASRDHPTMEERTVAIKGTSAKPVLQGFQETVP